MGLAAAANSVRSFFNRDAHPYQPLSGRNGRISRVSSHAHIRRNGRGPALAYDAEAVGDRDDVGGAMPTEEGEVDSVWARGNRSLLKLSLVLVSFVLILYLGVAFSRVASTPASCDSADHGYQCFPTVAQQWGQYSPFFSVPDKTDAALPKNCRYTFAQVLSRHGGRDPTAGKTVVYAALMQRIRDGVNGRFADGPDGAFAFLGDYTYGLGADELTRFGELQMVHSGAHFFHRYRALVAALPAAAQPFVRSAGQHRVVMSAVNWIQGFHRARVGAASAAGATASSDIADPTAQQLLVIPEERGYNNTLSYNGLCRAYSSRAGSLAQATFANTFVPAITARLNRGLPGADLSGADTIALMDLCPYETIADASDDGSGGAGRRLSPFCRLFSDAEWRDYDYYQTLGKWYGFGSGSRLGATQGVGFVNELVARLTASPVVDHTSTNRTLDADPATFPLDATLYADFSHDNDMANVFAALGLYDSRGLFGDAADLQPSNTTRTEPAGLRGFAASWVVPFAARMYVEKMVCEAEGESKGEGEQEELVRVLVNDRVMPLPGCGGDHLGRCRLSRFIESLSWARKGGDWDECFA